MSEIQSQSNYVQQGIPESNIGNLLQNQENFQQTMENEENIEDIQNQNFEDNINQEYINNNIDKNVTKNENSNQQNIYQENNNYENERNIPKFRDMETNTEQLSEETLQQFVENNRELLDSTFLLTIQADINDKIDTLESINELKRELYEKDKIFDLLVKSNNDLKEKIEISNKKYKEIIEKIDEKKNEDTEVRLTNQIKEMEKEISANNTETERYKKMIDNLKNKIEFQTNLERAFNLQNVLKQETQKNNELKKQYNALLRVNTVQKKYINNLDKENQISEKIHILQNEIKQTKETVKEYQEKYTKQDRFLRLIHEKILSIEMNIKKLKEPKVKEVKAFTREELKDTIDLIKTLKTQITENRNQLNLITKTNDDKLNQILNQNKKIEVDFKEAEKEHKRLLFKKNELKRQIKNSNVETNKQKKKFYLKENDEGINNREINENIENNNGAKLFSKNPNKIAEPEDENNLEQQSVGEGDDNLNDLNDSNAQVNDNNDSNIEINNNFQNNDDLL